MGLGLGLGLGLGCGFGLTAAAAAAKVNERRHRAPCDELRGEARELREGGESGRCAQQRRHMQLERERPGLG